MKGRHQALADVEAEASGWLALEATVVKAAVAQYDPQIHGPELKHYLAGVAKGLRLTHDVITGELELNP